MAFLAVSVRPLAAPAVSAAMIAAVMGSIQTFGCSKNKTDLPGFVLPCRYLLSQKELRALWRFEVSPVHFRNSGFERLSFVPIGKSCLHFELTFDQCKIHADCVRGQKNATPSIP